MDPKREQGAQHKEGPDRKDALINYVAIHILHKEFVWGLNDCNTICLGWADVLTGSDLAQKYIGSYSDPLSAARLQRDIGLDLAGVLKGAGAAPVIGKSELGDFVLVRQGREPWLRGHIVFVANSLFTVCEKDGARLFADANISPDRLILRMP